MSSAVVPRGRPGRALEHMSYVGIVAGLLLVASGLAMPASRAPVRYHSAAAMMGPDELEAWARAICTAIGLVVTAANGAAVAWHRWGKPPRKRRRRDTPSPPRPGPQ